MIWLLVGAVVLAGLATVVGIRRRSLLITVQGNSMSPTYRNGDRLLVRRGQECQVGDVVVFHHPRPIEGGPPMLVKRVAAVAGDPVPEEVRSRVDDSHVPPERLVVLGDSSHSLDSRNLGFIATGALLGTVVRQLARAA